LKKAWSLAHAYDTTAKKKTMTNNLATTPLEPSKKFAVKVDHLQKQWSLAQVKHAEMVVDPLGAVPALPFGHLNSVWEDFKQLLEEGDEIWSFMGTWKAEWGHEEVYEGCVIVRGETIGDYVLTRRGLVEEFV
jgi:hypothetical protein